LSEPTTPRINRTHVVRRPAHSGDEMHEAVVEERWLFRIVCVSAILGAILAGVGNLLHPVTPENDPVGVARNETINFALASLFNFIFAAATFILFGLAVALSDGYPRWLGWIVVGAGVASIGAGLIQAAVGEPTTASRVLTILGPTVITLWLLIMGILLLRRDPDRSS
jgi:hypothetical protein